MATIKDTDGGIEAILAESEVGRVLLDAVTGRTKYNINDNGEVKDPITGNTAYIFEGDLPAGGGIDVSATTATAKDVKQGKQFYNADGALTQGTNDDIDVSATTATEEDVLEGKQFYDADGTLTQGTLVQGGGGEFDINDGLDTLNEELSAVSGVSMSASDAEDIEDVNTELDNLNSELSTIKGE